MKAEVQYDKQIGNEQKFEELQVDEDVTKFSLSFSFAFLHLIFFKLSLSKSFFENFCSDTCLVILQFVLFNTFRTFHQLSSTQFNHTEEYP
jgi:hypothetical protein